MRGIVQRVSRASVKVDGNITGEIGQGILLFLGVGKGDSRKDADYLVNKVAKLRIFQNEGRMNSSLLDISGGLLIVSQFTLFGDVRKGLRPSFTSAADPSEAKELYDYFVKKAVDEIERVATGVFQAMMEVELVNDGPVTILLDSKREF